MVRFPLPMALLMALIARLPDAVVARLMAGRAGSQHDSGPAESTGGARAMIDLALKMLLDDKARFAATVLGVGFAAALGAGPGRPLLRAARERQHHDRPARRRPLGDRAEHAQRRLRQPVPRDATCSASGRSRAWRGPTT